MAVSAINVTIEQGADFFANFTIKNPDESSASLATYTTLGTIKKYPGSSVGIALSTSLNTQTAVATIGLGRTITGALSSGRYYYDVFLVSQNGTRTKVVEGNALVNPSATLP